MTTKGCRIYMDMKELQKCIKQLQRGTLTSVWMNSSVGWVGIFHKSVAMDSLSRNVLCDSPAHVVINPSNRVIPSRLGCYHN